MMKLDLIEFMKDHLGQLSSKRLIIAVATLLMMGAFVINMFWGYKVEEFMYSSMRDIVFCGIGGTVAEKFSNNPFVQKFQNKFINNDPPPATDTPQK